MRWTSDLVIGALYFKLSDEPIVAQRALADGLIVDLDANDALVGIEVLGEDARGELLANATRLELSEDDLSLIVAVITNQVYGAREVLGLEGPLPVASEDSYRELQLQP